MSPSGKTTTDFQGVPSHRLAIALVKQICRARSFFISGIFPVVANPIPKEFEPFDIPSFIFAKNSPGKHICGL